MISQCREENGSDVVEVAAIRKAMDGLFAKLDTLTHFHFTPKNLNAEVKVGEHKIFAFTRQEMH